MIQFSKGNKIFPIVSLVAIVSLFAITYAVFGGFNKSIDFTSGLDLRIKVENTDAESIRVALSELDSLQVQAIGGTEGNLFSVRFVLADTSKNDVEINRVVDLLKENLAVDNVEVESSLFVGSRYAKTLTTNTVWLIILTLSVILIYITIRFKFIYGIGALVALVHDSLFMIAINGAFQLETSSITIAAILTIIGYSLNDTVVIFDRIRENIKYHGAQHTFIGTVDVSVNQTLSRTLITSLTTLVAVVPLYLLSTGQPQLFALNMIIGIVIGTYSSIFIANPTLTFLRLQEMKRHEKKQQRKEHGHLHLATHKSAPKQAKAVTLKVQTAEEIKAATEEKRKKREEKHKKRAKKKK